MDGTGTIIDHIYEVCRINIVCDGTSYYRDAVCREARIGLCSSLRSAEDVIKKDVKDFSFLEPAHSYFVRYLQLDRPMDDFMADSEFLYDRSGIFQEQWMRRDDATGVEGHETPGCRFRQGDICEVLWADMRPHPAIIAQLPPERDNEEFAYRVVMIDETGKCVEMSIDKLRIHKPRERIHPSTVRKLRKALEDFRTLPVRRAIESTAYEQRLRALLGDLGITIRILPPEYTSDDMLDLLIETSNLPGYKQDVSVATPFGQLKRISIGIPYWKIDKRPEMIRNGLLMLLGRHYTGKAFRLKEAEEPELPRDPESKYYYY